MTQASEGMLAASLAELQADQEALTAAASRGLAGHTHGTSKAA